MTDHGTSQSPYLHEPIPHNKSFSINLYISFSLKNAESYRALPSAPRSPLSSTWVTQFTSTAHVSQVGFSEKTLRWSLWCRVFIMEALGINTCGREVKKQEWAEQEMLSCGAGPTLWELWSTCALQGCLEWYRDDQAFIVLPQ